jgi:hypothetical protein
VEHARFLISPAYDLGEDEAQVIVRMRAYFDGVLARRNLPNA